MLDLLAVCLCVVSFQCWWVHYLAECVLVGSVAVSVAVAVVVVDLNQNFCSARVERRILPCLYVALSDVFACSGDKLLSRTFVTNDQGANNFGTAYS